MHMHITSPQADYHSRTMISKTQRASALSKGQCVCMHTLPIMKHESTTISFRKTQICVRSVQQVQTHLSLFPKSFVHTSHMVLVHYQSQSSINLCMQLTTQICIPVPRSVTQQTYTVHRGLRMANRILTFIDTFFQHANICTPVGNTLHKHNSKPEAPIIKLSMSVFIRNY